jgi:hypothetical protein
MTQSSQRDDTTTHRRATPAGRVIKAINDSFRQMHVLVERAAEPTDEHVLQQLVDPDVVLAGRRAPGGGFVAELKTANAEQAQLSTVEIAVVKGRTGAERSVTRTEQRNDRFDLDLNLFLPDLDQYTAAAIKRLLTENLRSFLAAARQENCEERITQLVKAIAPPDPLADVELKVAEATVSLRREFLEQVPVLTSAEVHANAGFPGGNPSQTVHRWRKQGKIFAVNHGGRDLYPAFQFGVDGRPLPIIADVLTILKRDSDRADWDNALWFAGDSGWLDGKAPLDCLQSDPDGVKRAAEQEVLRDEY